MTNTNKAEAVYIDRDGDLFKREPNGKYTMWMDHLKPKWSFAKGIHTQQDMDENCRLLTEEERSCYRT